MPNSIMSVRQVPADNNGLKTSVSKAASLGELLELVPAIFRPRMQHLVNSVYKAAIKSNHARTYLSTLEKHFQDNTFPPEIGGRVNLPSLQISKEFMASAESKELSAARDIATRQHKVAMLESAIATKRAEVTHLQTLFSDDRYNAELIEIGNDVVTALASDAGVEPTLADGKPNLVGLPPWIKADVDTFLVTKERYPQRAIALAYMAVQIETTKKFKSLSLKRQVDEDVEMQDASSKTETVDALVNRKLEQLIKEYKITKPGNGNGRKTNKAKPSPKGKPKPQTQKVTKAGTGKGKGKGGKKTPGKSRS